ncbi:hypothetical protein BDB00DRAFT_926056 [Zychaea mexicana]|uniref:uncharacterized protein n=1 Tax=Zychaea mexicana TaxID=64656 RepID=UPI0022FECB36|nr:uncharacterized protein BDB00DRAFT_926056 [Zychaea mexicana]KAI9497164.1 hypothetical protein BDB00DRAFT_926056 [Zychaea mexicana]
MSSSSPRNGELEKRRQASLSVQCLRPTRTIDPVLYLPASQTNRHRLINWRLHWLPGYYPWKDCRCGARAVTRDHYSLVCPLLRPLWQELTDAYGTAPSVPSGMHTIDVILNKIPRTDVVLSNGRWPTIWPAILSILREIERLCHPEDHLLDGEFPGDDISLPLPSEHD